VLKSAIFGIKKRNMYPKMSRFFACFDAPTDAPTEKATQISALSGGPEPGTKKPPFFGGFCYHFREATKMVLSLILCGF
jgi:hypothetical protein